MEWKRVQGSVRPPETDTTSSKTLVYLRKNIKEVTKEQDGTTYTAWEYDEATLTRDEYFGWYLKELQSPALEQTSQAIAPLGTNDNQEVIMLALADIADLLATI